MKSEKTVALLEAIDFSKAERILHTDNIVDTLENLNSGFNVLIGGHCLLFGLENDQLGDAERSKDATLVSVDNTWCRVSIPVGIYNRVSKEYEKRMKDVQKVDVETVMEEIFKTL